MNKILKNRVVIALVAITAACGCMALYAKSVQSTAEKVQVVRLKQNIPKGTMIKKSDIEVVTVGGYNINKKIIRSADVVTGKYATADMPAGGYILPEQITNKLSSISDKMAELNGKRVAYSVTIKDFADGLSDKLVTGDIVQVYVSKGGHAFVPSVLTYVEVLATTTGKGTDKKSADDKTNGESLKTVTLLVTKEQAIELTKYEDSAEIHLALVYRGQEKIAEKFLEKQREVLKGE